MTLNIQETPHAHHQHCQADEISERDPLDGREVGLEFAHQGVDHQAGTLLAVLEHDVGAERPADQPRVGQPPVDGLQHVVHRQRVVGLQARDQRQKVVVADLRQLRQEGWRATPAQAALIVRDWLSAAS